MNAVASTTRALPTRLVTQVERSTTWNAEASHAPAAATSTFAPPRSSARPSCWRCGVSISERCLQRPPSALSASPLIALPIRSPPSRSVAGPPKTANSPDAVSPFSRSEKTPPAQPRTSKPRRPKPSSALRLAASSFEPATDGCGFPAGSRSRNAAASSAWPLMRTR